MGYATGEAKRKCGFEEEKGETVWARTEEGLSSV
jgi:hypothetical protein